MEVQNVSDKIYNMATEGKNLRIKMPDAIREQFKPYWSGLTPENFNKSKDRLEYSKKLTEFTNNIKKLYPQHFRKIVKVRDRIIY